MAVKHRRPAGAPTAKPAGSAKPSRMNLLTHNWKYAFFIGAIMSVCLMIFGQVQKFLAIQRVFQPLSDVTVIESSPGSSKEMFWGTYRPGVYFGVRAKVQDSPVFGFMWAKQGQNKMPLLRHWCEQNDKLTKYGWEEHDGRMFGIQNIVDDECTIVNKFAKIATAKKAGNWAADFSLKTTSNSNLYSMFFYVGMVGKLGHYDFKESHDGFIFNFLESVVGPFELKVSSPQFVRINVRLASYDVDGFENIHTEMQKKMIRSQDGFFFLNGDLFEDESHNVFMIQLSSKTDFSMKVNFIQNYGLETFNEQANFDRFIGKASDSFGKKFQETFSIANLNSKETQAYQAFLSNMLGSLSFFHGKSIVSAVSNDKTEEPKFYWPAPLYTAVPSRSFFPRGFLWDEGFHQLLIANWDPSLAMLSVGHWLDLMNADGWIPREQILDSEARARVPTEFLVQTSNHANPPALLLAIEKLVNLAEKSDDNQEIVHFLMKAYQRLVAWYNWFMTTQVGQKPGTFVWHGRTPTVDNKVRTKELNPKTLMSGLDDYPRSSHPRSPPGEERHIDLHSWMIYSAKVLSRVATLTGNPSDANRFAQSAENLSSEEALALYWDSKAGRFADFGYHTDSCSLKEEHYQSVDPNTGQRSVQTEIWRRCSNEPKLRHVTQAHGYISIFPLILKVLEPSSDKLGVLLKNLKRSDDMWSPYGLRSLAKSSPWYGKRNTQHDPPYWRGDVWININFLAVRALHHYSTVEGPHATLAGELYRALRTSITSNVMKQYLTTGYLWERYSDVDGTGMGCHPFTGWTSLTLLMMAEKYD